MNQRNEWENLDTSKLTDEELKSEIIRINNTQLSNIRDMAYYYLTSRIGEIIDLLENKNLFKEMTFTEEKKTLVKSFNIIIDSFRSFKEEMSEIQIHEEIRLIMDTREKLHGLIMVLFAYEVEISYIKELIDHHIMKEISKSEYKNRSLEKVEINILINKIRKALDNAISDDVIFMSIVSNILSIIPFRMTKNKFFDIVKSTLYRNYNNYQASIVRGKMEEYKILFDGRLIGDYGILFDNYFTTIQKFKNMDITSKSINEIDNIVKDILQLSSEIKELSIFIRNLGVLFNRLIVIYLLKGEISINLEMENAYKKLEEYYRKREEKLLNSLIKSCDKELETLEKGILNEINYLENINQEAAIRQGFDDESFNEKILFTSKILAYYNDLKFTKLDLLFPKKYEIVEKDYLIQLVDNLLQYMNRSISTMTNIERKIRMRRLLSILQLPFENMEEFLTYIKYTLDGTAMNKEEILFSIDAINFLLEEYVERQ